MRDAGLTELNVLDDVRGQDADELLEAASEERISLCVETDRDATTYTPARTLLTEVRGELD